MLHEKGVPILAGTDAPNPGTAHGASVHRELRLLVDAGLTPAAALAAATSAPARAFKLSDRGRIAPGLRADLVLVNGDPTRDIGATRDIVTIWKRGVRVERPRAAPETTNAETASAAAGTPIASGEVSDFDQGTTPSARFGMGDFGEFAVLGVEHFANDGEVAVDGFGHLAQVEQGNEGAGIGLLNG